MKRLELGHPKYIVISFNEKSNKNFEKKSKFEENSMTNKHEGADLV